MHSGELAALAGVTVRTLRHYHRMGLLDEPERGSNGYRRYDARHLSRVLRITRIARLGVPLADLPPVLDEPDAVEELLDGLDRQAAAEMERLTARRAEIARLRRDGVAPDLPPVLVPYARALAESGVPAREARRELEPLALLSHLVGASGAAVLTALYARMGEAGRADADLLDRFHRLGPDSTDDEVHQVVEDTVVHYAAILAELPPTPDPSLPELPAQTESLVGELTDRLLNDRQRHVTRMVGERLERMLEGP